MTEDMPLCVFPVPRQAVAASVKEIARCRGVDVFTPADMPNRIAIRGPQGVVEEIMELSGRIGMCVERFRIELLSDACSGVLQPKLREMLHELTEWVESDPEAAKLYRIASVRGGRGGEPSLRDTPVLHVSGSSREDPINREGER
ncbi:MAG: hypothetical protein V3W34_14965 [Phycisphaerae bacterium]